MTAERIEALESALRDGQDALDKSEAMVALLMEERNAALAASQPASVKVAECATEGCGNPSSVHFIRGDIGSHYCMGCYLQVQKQVRQPAFTAYRVVPMFTSGKASDAAPVGQPSRITQIASGVPVQVCPICDIAGCRHIREVASQPAPECQQPELVTADAQAVAHHDLEPVAWRHRYTTPAPDGTRIEQWGFSVTQMWPDDLPLYPAKQPLTVQDAARVPEIVALIEAAKRASRWKQSGSVVLRLNNALRAITEVK